MAADQVQVFNRICDKKAPKPHTYLTLYLWSTNLIQLKVSHKNVLV